MAGRPVVADLFGLPPIGDIPDESIRVGSSSVG